MAGGADIETELLRQQLQDAQTQVALKSALLAEMRHRITNMMATIKAIMNLSARSATDLPSFMEAFNGRIDCLAKTYNLVANYDGKSASLIDMLESELRYFDEDRGGRILLEGETVLIPADYSLPLCMAIHELATNAVKYGALKNPGGSVRVRWKESDSILLLNWRERGGPPVKPPTRKGFGTALLHQVLRIQANAEIETHFHPDGIELEVTLPLALSD